MLRNLRTWRCLLSLSMALSVSLLPSTGAAQGPSAGTYEDGVRLGNRNAGILFSRLKLRTVDTQGCSAIGQLETALVRVSASVHAPNGSSDRLVRGFYRGYQEVIRDSLREVRRGCGALRHESGAFVGNYLGSLACNGSAFLEPVELLSFYGGWANQDSGLERECLESAREVLWGCIDSSGEIPRALERAVSAACLDAGESELLWDAEGAAR